MLYADYSTNFTLAFAEFNADNKPTTLNDVSIGISTILLVSNLSVIALDSLRSKGEGLAASKCIHINWQSANGRTEAKRRQKVRQERMQVEVKKKQFKKAKKKALRDAASSNNLN